MKRVMKKTIIPGLVLTLVVFFSTVTIQLGTSIAEVDEWSEGILTKVRGIDKIEGHSHDRRTFTHEEKAKMEIVLNDDRIFKLDPEIKVTDNKGMSLSLDQLGSYSRIRFIQEHGVIKEIVLIGGMPR